MVSNVLPLKVILIMQDIVFWLENLYGTYNLYIFIYRFVAMLIGLPFILYYQTHVEPEGCTENCTVHCYSIWPDGVQNNSPTEFV